MWRGKTRLAPEPHFSAYNYLIYQVAMFLRSRPQISGDQCFDLGDAIHNVPEFLARHAWRDEARFRAVYLEPYDRKWVKSERDFSLIRALEEGYRRCSETDGPGVRSNQTVKRVGTVKWSSWLKALFRRGSGR